MIQPAVDQAYKKYPDLKENAFSEKAVETNVYQTMAQLSAGSLVLRELISDHKLKIVGAVSDLETGKVRWLPAR